MQIFLTYKTIFKTKDLFVDLPYLIIPHEKFEYKLVSVFSLTVKSYSSGTESNIPLL